MKTNVAHLEDERLAREAEEEARNEGRIKVKCAHCAALVYAKVAERLGEPLAIGNCPRCGCAFTVLVGVA